MISLNRVDDVRKYVNKWRKKGLSIGLVPTMGCLHEGHKSLIDKAVKENDKVVVSVFVNPTQFGPNEDFNKYPRNLKNDMDICEKVGVSIIFNPNSSEMYCDDASTYVNVEKLTEGLCGAKRQGHFKGVCTVVSKLFNIVTPRRAYFGVKDAQQLAIIKRMVRDLNFNIDIIGCPIIREDDGLAKSSRNKYLSYEERRAAAILSKSLKNAKMSLKNGERDVNKVKNIIKNKILEESLANIDYIEIVDSVTLQNINTIDHDALVAIAVFIGNTRLIDNFTFKWGE
ncbi:pantoate--beta-alanine ligase [Clostridium botulinum]|uniref:pantoate--beta-alanine ligase n=1 Tax=Clostridium botulinum TaxID=1491 RepID=UPI0004D4C951|nr:pantoate--beta-alanine ligase [Clostridium botulinum]KEI05073.1 pantoate--beta-alanine ligase [Clostridium botulinum C/D str. BKT75002]KEI11917.1 pantoate--beta-alanine ligase [Clostridium botulinum C/D str. BKT2873]MCD3350362.1 pantoate--beta-alanine ligase [Clostridium botulinum D/C]MCD3359382.1 pantoate--beta-alanine ligase [Clostridium botulinum D/C]MCD3361743.1 pantoate--beta-alanine ligase [Clostridium botulinum D/C]